VIRRAHTANSRTDEQSVYLAAACARTLASAGVGSGGCGDCPCAVLLPEAAAAGRTDRRARSRIVTVCVRAHLASARRLWHRDVPSFLQYPDGSHSLGVISPVGGRAEEEEAGAGSQSGTITGSFVVWADPGPPPGNTASMKLLFFGLLMIDVVVCILILADAVKKLTSRGKSSRMSPPPVEHVILSFAFGFLFKLVGAWGVHTNNLRWISIFIAATLFITIWSLLWTTSLAHLFSLFLDVALVLVGNQERSLLMGTWFSASR